MGKLHDRPCFLYDPLEYWGDGRPGDHTATPLAHWHRLIDIPCGLSQEMALQEKIDRLFPENEFPDFPEEKFPHYKLEDFPECLVGHENRRQS